MDNKMSTIPSQNFSSSSAILIVLDMDHLIEEILSHLHVSDLELRKYRLVNPKWNDLIVGKMIKSRDSFQVKLRYGGVGIPRFIIQSDAERWASKVLESATRALTLTSRTVTRLPFDSLLIDRDFFLAGLLPQWLHFLKVYGKTIRHLKIDIRSSKFPGRYVNYVKDCEVIVTSDCLRAIFRAVPNLETLDLCARFSHYGSKFPMAGNIEPIFRNGRDIPKLKKLAKITLQEPHKDEYPIGFVKEILAMAPKLSYLFIKPARSPAVFATALKVLAPKIHPTLRTLKISNADASSIVDFWFSDMLHFPHFDLTTLEIDNFDPSCNRTNAWIEHLLEAFQSSLVTLILGNREWDKYYFEPDREHSGLTFPRVMKSLKILEVNLTKFELRRIVNYQEKFPVLENITLTNYAEKENVWAYRRITQLLPGDSGKSNTVKEFSLLGQMPEFGQGEIIQGVSTTFPKAEQIFDL